MDINNTIVVGHLAAHALKSKLHVDMLVKVRANDRTDIVPVRIMAGTLADHIDTVGLAPGIPVRVVGSLRRTWGPAGSRLRVIATDVKVG